MHKFNFSFFDDFIGLGVENRKFKSRNKEQRYTFSHSQIAQLLSRNTNMPKNLPKMAVWSYILFAYFAVEVKTKILNIKPNPHFVYHI